MQLSPHFRLVEFVRDDVLRQADVPPEVVAQLRILCVELLEPLRELGGTLWGREVGLRVISGYRVAGTTSAIGHRAGAAADVQLILDADELAAVMPAGLNAWQQRQRASWDLWAAATGAELDVDQLGRYRALDTLHAAYRSAAVNRHQYHTWTR